MPLKLKLEVKGWHRILIRTLDLLYPPSCALCRANLTLGRALCDICHEDLPRLADPFCRKCGEAFPGEIDRDFDCPNCGKLKFAFEFARPAMVRDARTLELIHRLKYRRELYLAADLGRLAAEAFMDARLNQALSREWPLVPVPLHTARFQHRHFNQAAEIARALSRHTDLPVLHALRRIRATSHQTVLNRFQRMENLRGAFVPSLQGSRCAKENPEGVILVDDVFTTGSTVNECAKVLRKAGFQRVIVITVMRG
jgi:competence protein ComFC